MIKLTIIIFSGYFKSSTCVTNLYDNLKETFDRNGCTKDAVSNKIERVQSGMISSTVRSQCKDFDTENCKAKSDGDKTDDGFVDTSTLETEAFAKK